MVDAKDPSGSLPSVEEIKAVIDVHGSARTIIMNSRIFRRSGWTPLRLEGNPVCAYLLENQLVKRDGDKLIPTERGIELRKTYGLGMLS